MSQSTWLHRLRGARRGGRRASVQVGLHRSATHWVAARVRLDPGAGPSVEQFETVAVGSPREQEAIRQLGRTGILRNAPVVLVLGAEQYNTFPLPALPFRIRSCAKRCAGNCARCCRMGPRTRSSNSYG